MLSLSVYRLVFTAVTRVELQAFAGSAWRGAFGHALKRSCCVMRMRPCEGCALEHACIYPTVFEARPGPEAERMRLYPNVPQPYVLRPVTPTPCALEAGERFELEVVLIGRAGPHVAYVVRALERAAAHGVGRDRGRLELADLAPVALPEPEPLPDRVRVVLETPLRLVADGHVVAPRRFAAAPFLMALLRRLSMLAYFHHGRELKLDFRALKTVAAEVSLHKADLRFVDQVRRSARQQRLLRMGGLVGHAEFDLGRAAVFKPLLAHGQWVHVGKGATMGLGRYRLAEASAE